MAAHFIDLTDSRRDWDGEFDDDADKRAFGVNVQGRRLYGQQIWKLKQNDPNFRLLELDSRRRLSNEQCARIGTYLCSSTYVKKLLLDKCSLDLNAVEHFFGRIALQNETNEFILREDILGGIGVIEETHVASIIDCVTSFRNLVDVNISRNPFGTKGLGTLIKALSGTPVEDLNISGCGINGIDPLRGTRRCMRLKTLDVSDNRVGLDDVETVSILMDGGYPKLRELHLQSCGIGDDLVERIASVISTNKSLREVALHNYYGRGINNEIGARGAAALSKAVHDKSSFKKTLASNHTIWKIIVEGDHSSLFWACHPNRRASGRRRGPLVVAWEKHLYHIAKSDDADMSPFMSIDMKLIPKLLAWIWHTELSLWDKSQRLDVACSVFFKLWACTMFRERIEMASRINNLQFRNERLHAKAKELDDATKRCVELERGNAKLAEENKRLREQMAKLVAQASESKPKTREKLDAGVASIAERVKARKNGRKRGRRG